MSEGQSVREKSASKDTLSIAQFQQELRRGVQALAPMAHANPLAEVVQSIECNPAIPQSRLLTRLLAALISQAGEFRSAEIFAFDTKTRAMVVALLDAFASGMPGRDEWQRAADSASAAQRAWG
jgi:hypothetical protein